MCGEVMLTGGEVMVTDCGGDVMVTVVMSSC